MGSTKYILRLMILISLVEIVCQIHAQSLSSEEAFVIVVSAEEMVDDGMRVVIKRAVDEANKGATALILEIDTPGGLVDSAIDITNDLLNAKCPTVAYIRGMGAISAGALVAYACKHIVIAPGSNIGASAPIVLGEAQPSEEFNEKTKSFLRSRYRSLAEVNGHNSLLAEAMVDTNVEVWGVKMPNGKYDFFPSKGEAIKFVEEKLKEKDSSFEGEGKKDIVKSLYEYDLSSVLFATNRKDSGEESEDKEEDLSEPISFAGGIVVKQICKKGELLTLTSKEAYEFGIASLVANSIEEILKHYGWETARVMRLEPTWGEKIFRFLSNPLVAGLLLLIGLAGLYFELQTPGFGIPGTVGLISLALFFGAQYVIGLANWADLILILIGITLLGIEIFVLPGFGITGFAGLGCIVLGIYLALTRVVFPVYPWDFERLQNAGKTVLIGAFSFAVIVAVTWKYLPKSLLFQRISLSHSQIPEAGYTVQSSKDETTWIGAVGVTETVLRPAGKGRFSGILLDVVSQGEYLEAGTKIKIVEVQGNRYVVVPIAENQEKSNE
ncbi:MAG: hypothetical protein N3G21_05190 [Candidatus Hydrogenedentes bacterium]|nr:hypothetical protein [Candidatus Hydrogenedentota bacterium]